MRRLITSIAFALTALGASAQSNFELQLYPNGAPQSNGLVGENQVVRDGFAQNITTPKLFVFMPEKAKATGKAVVIAPGGGYGGVAFKHEGEQFAKWFNDMGIAAAVLWYRMPNGHCEIPLSDMHRAIEIVRGNATEWSINPNNVGVMGSSAGGHLASTASTKFTEATRPNFAILLYPVITMGEYTHAGSRRGLLGQDPSTELKELYSSELHVSGQTPPTFIALSDDDKGVLPINSTLYYNALKKAGIPAEMHIYPKGGHGWGFRDTWGYSTEFLSALKRWLQEVTP